MDELVKNFIFADPALERARTWLCSYKDRCPGEAVPEALREELSETKRAAVQRNDQHLAKAIWCLESIGKVQTHYLHAFEQMQNGQFYAAWCSLEQAEVTLHFLDRHFRDDGERFGLEFIRDRVQEFQSIYPYALFLSPEIWEKQVRCSICDGKMSPRGGCDHRTGELYNGKMCKRIIHEAVLLSVSLVRNPVQKYSVAFAIDPATSGGNPNPDAYPTVRYVIECVESPWHWWHGEWTTERHPHSRYADVGPGEECPCVSPQGTYEECCLRAPGVLRPHLSVAFEVPPPLGKRETVYT